MSRVIPLVGSICLLHVLVGCARPEALTGRVSALAVPVPVLLGPVRCLGECGAEPAGSHAFKTAPTVEIASERRTTSTSTSSASTVLGTQTTTTTSTAVSRGESSAVLFSGALLGPLLAQPFSRRRVIQLSRLDLGRTVDEVTGTNRNSSDVSLLVSGRGGWHVLPAPRAAAGEPEKETRE